MTQDIVQAVVGSYEEGLYTFPELAAKLLELSASHSLDDLAAALPDGLRARFVAHLKGIYANDLPAEEFVSLTGDARMSPVRLADLRDWLSRQG